MHTQQQHNPQQPENPGFDPDSPDLADPQVDPIGPAEVPDSDQDPEQEKRVDDDQYPPFEKDQNRSGN